MYKPSKIIIYKLQTLSHAQTDACRKYGSLPIDIQCVKVEVAHLADKGLAKGRAHRDIGLQNVLDVFHNLCLTQDYQAGPALD